MALLPEKTTLLAPAKKEITTYDYNKPPVHEPGPSTEPVLLPQEQNAQVLQARQKQIPSKTKRSGLKPLDTLQSKYSFKPMPVQTTLEIKSVGSRVPKEQELGLVSKTFDFLFGSEAAILGVAHDAEGWSWSVENLQQQWSEQPLWKNALAMTSLVGTMVMPAGLAARSTLKFGKLATKMGRYGGEAAEIAKWKDRGMLGDQSIMTFADLGDDADKTVKMLRRQEIALDRYTAMTERAKMAADGTLKHPVEWGLHQFEKRFSQTYNTMIGNAANGDVKSAFHDIHNQLWKNDTVGTILRDMPNETAGPAIYAYLMGRVNPNLAPKLTQQMGKLSAKDKKWADFYFEAAKKRQSTMLEDGFITPETYKSIGQAHIPAQLAGTPDAALDNARTYLIPLKGKKMKRAAGIVAEEVPTTGLERLFRSSKTVFKPEGEVEYIAAKIGTKPRLDSPTLLHRSGTQDEIYDRLISGKLITDPADLTMRGYMTDGLLHTNFQFVRDLALDSRNIATAADMAAWGGDAAKAAKAGFIPLSYGGEHASAVLRRMIAKKTGKPEEALPWIRKEIFDEVFGKDGMMNQTTSAVGDMMDVLTTIHKTSKTAGSIPTHLQNLVGNMVFLSQAGFNVADPKNIALMGSLTGTFSKISDAHAAAKKAGIGGRSLFNKETGLLKGVDLGDITVNGRTFDLNDEMFDPVVRELIEESSFDSVEGAGALENMARTLRSDQNMTRGIIKGYMKVKNIAQLGGKAPWFDKLTKAYLAEDMVPKMSYYMHLRGKGFSKAAAATEVARRLPMYNTVGAAIKQGRRFAFPWATFPAEAIRITKNNIMDHPLRMIPWLRAPQLMQAAMGATGLGPETRQEAQEAMRQLPFWAQSSTTIVGEGGAISTGGGAATGGLLGAAAGAIAGKSPAAVLAGAGAGALFGGTLAALTTDEEHEKQLRGAMLDFLPYSSFSLTTNSVDFGGDLLPFKDVKGAIEQSPAEPLAILKPLIAIASGETPYGEQVGDGTVAGGVNKAIAGMLGFVAPPLLQKYGFKLTTPDVPLWGEPGSVFNVSRALVDTGNAIDPMTGLPGSFGHDFLLNNFGVWKSYATSAEQQLANEGLADKNLTQVRNYLSKNLAYNLENGNDAEVVSTLSEVQATYANQYVHDPRLAQEKYTEWLTRYTKQLGRHPKLRGWTEDEIQARLIEVGKMAGGFRSQARQQMLEALRREMLMRSKQ